MKLSNQTAALTAKLDTKDKQNNVEKTKKLRPRSNKQQMTFGIALVIACSIGIPFGWYAYSINQFARIKSPDWFYP